MERVLDHLPDGLAIRIKLSPGASRERFLGFEADADGRIWLKAAVTAPADRGAANAALIALLARHAGIPKSAIHIASGAGARRKRLVLRGDRGEIAHRMNALLGTFEQK
ncbi:MAG: hypothetical protein Tsb008_20270 [Rhodothalassiaceae bacterium]